MSIFDSIKKLVKGDSSPSSNPSSPSSNTSSPSKSTFGQRYDFNPYHCGLYDNATSIHYDCVQKLLAVGFNNGLVKIFGQNGMECHFKSDANTVILKLIFIVDSPFILVVSSNSIEKWNYHELKVTNVLNFKNRITSIGYSFGCNFIYIGDETGIIQVYNVVSHFLSSYKITVENVFQSAQQKQQQQQQQANIPIYPSAIDICPSDNNILLIGYSNGVIVTWNNEVRRVEKTFNQFRSFVTKVVWSRKGSKFVCGFFDGCVYMVDIPKMLPMLIFKPIGLDASTSGNSNPEGGDAQATSARPERVSIDQLELVYTKDKKIILFKGYFHSPGCLVMIKGDNYKEIQKLGVSQVCQNITAFVPIIDLPYPSVKELTAIMVLSAKSEIIHYKFDNIMLPSPMDELNLKNMLGAPNSVSQPLLAECYECESQVKDMLMEAFQPNGRAVTLGGQIKHSRLFQLMISVHSDHTIKFWDFTDSKSYQLLGKLEGIPPNPITMSFSITNLILAVSFADGQVQLFSLSNVPRRIDKSIYPTPIPQTTTPSPPITTTSQESHTQQLQEKQEQSSPPQQPQSDQSPTSQPTSTQLSSSTNTTNTQQSPPQQPSVQQQEQQLPSYLSLPDPVWSGCQLISEWRFPQHITSIAMNPLKSLNCVRVVLGSAGGSIYHFTLSMTNNSGIPGVTVNRTVYSSSIDFRGMSKPFTDGEGKVSPITSLSLCFMPFRSGEDISVLHAGTESGHILAIDLPTLQRISAFRASQTAIQSMFYMDKNARPLQYVFIDLPNLENMSINNQNTTTNTTSNPNLSLRLEDINLKVCSLRELLIFNVPSKQLSLFNGIELLTNSGESVIQHERLFRAENKVPIVKSFVFRDIASDKKFIATFDQSNQLQFYTLENLARIFSITIPNTTDSSKVNLVLSSMLGNIFVNTSNSNYSLCLQPSSQRHHYQFYDHTIRIPPEPKDAQSSLAKFFFGRAPVKLEDTFSEGCTVQHNPTAKQKVYVEEISSQLAETINSLNERGKKISELDEKVTEMANASHTFSRMAKDLKKANESWF